MEAQGCLSEELHRTACIDDRELGHPIIGWAQPALLHTGDSEFYQEICILSSGPHGALFLQYTAKSVGGVAHTSNHINHLLVVKSESKYKIIPIIISHSLSFVLLYPSYAFLEWQRKCGIIANVPGIIHNMQAVLHMLQPTIRIIAQVFGIM